MTFGNFVTFGNFLGFYSIKNSYMRFIEKRRESWTVQGRQDVFDRIQTDTHKEQHILALKRRDEIRKMEASQRARYFVFDITFPLIRDAFGSLP